MDKLKTVEEWSIELGEQMRRLRFKVRLDTEPHAQAALSAATMRAVAADFQRL